MTVWVPPPAPSTDQNSVRLPLPLATAFRGADKPNHRRRRADWALDGGGWRLKGGHCLAPGGGWRISGAIWAILSRLSG